ncbi:hypothetical protein BuS5_01965 [Desulfosarcina sp. BuS5]|uniref:hypothetical protein n=1 Tax=Desulfosarcina sp. BuS5 TaxID=933262 RepID=UPI0004821881|nr:hypothetical protein [Desulfosarcina sp. BuS5]WDN88997.1 hypothetical protein BuS5_01965 [Desulfosarcina sp. BuS5]
MQPRISKTLNYIFITATCLLLAIPTAFAGNKKIMTTRAAKIIAERAIVESVYGLKLRATEEVKDMIAASFVGSTESKTSAKIKGIKIEDVVYDPEKDIAKATASIQLDSITNIDGKTIDLNNKIFRRVGFATSTPSQSGPLKALRAAELDAYTQIIKRIVGFTLESQSTVKNYMLTSDLVKTKVMATTYLAEVVDYGWDESGDAFVKMRLNTKEVAAMMGEGIVGEDEIIEVEGSGAREDDYKTAQKK